MSKKLFLLVAFLLIGGLAFAGGTDQLGQGGYPSDAHRIYRLVHNAGAGELAANAMVIWDLTEDNGVSVTTTTLSSDSAVAGILIEAISAQSIAANTAAEDIGRANWGLMQTFGLSTVDITAAVDIAGSAMGTGTVAGEANMFSPSTTQAILNGKAGFFYDAAAAGAEDVECFLILD